MANKWRTATGLYSTAAEWNGGTLPEAGDTCFANGYTCTIDVASLSVNFSTEASAGDGVAAGGGFQLNASSGIAGFTHNGNTKPGSSNCLTVTGFSGWFVHESGTYEGGATSSRYPFYWANGAPNATLKGTYKPGTASNNYTYFTPSIDGGTITFDGATIDAVGSQTAFYVNSSLLEVSVVGTVTITLNGTNAVPIALNGAGVDAVLTIPVLTFNGGSRVVAVSATARLVLTVQQIVLNSITYANAASAPFYAVTNGILDVTVPDVDLTDFPLTSLQWVFADTGGVIDYRGDIVCGYGLSSYVFRTHSGGNATIRHHGKFTGPAQFAIAAGAYSQLSSSVIILDEIVAGDGGLPTLTGLIRFKDTSIIRAKNESGILKTFVESSEVGDPPAVGNVRDGTRYHFDTLEGTLAVPLANQVAAGVAVDDTVGTAVLTIGQVSANAVIVGPIKAQQEQRVINSDLVAYIDDTAILGPVAITAADGTTPVNVAAFEDYARVWIEPANGTGTRYEVTPTVSGDDGNQITFALPAAVVAAVSNWIWSLRDTTGSATGKGKHVAGGTLNVRRAAKAPA